MKILGISAYYHDSAAALVDDAPARPAQGGLQGRLERALDEGSWLAFLLVFLGGVLADVVIDTSGMTPSEATREVLLHLERQGYISAPDAG